MSLFHLLNNITCYFDLIIEEAQSKISKRYLQNLLFFVAHHYLLSMSGVSYKGCLVKRARGIVSHLMLQNDAKIFNF